MGGSVPNINSNNAAPSAMAQHWNGSSWSEGPSVIPAGSKLSLLWNVTCVNAADCWAVGAQMADTDSDKVPVPLAEHWNGSVWSVVPLPSTFGILFSVTCTGASDCWAAGTTVSDDNQSNPLNGFVDHWNGSSWSPVPTVPSGQKFDQFNSVTCSSASDCWAVGFAGPNQLQNNFLPNVAPNVAGAQAFIEHWNGADWNIVPAPAATAPDGTYLADVTCSSPSECLAVGATMGADGNPSTTLVDRWNGADWSTSPSPNPDNPADVLTDVTCLGTSDCWAVGASGVHSGPNSNGIQPNPFVERWNGSTWSVDPSPNVTAFGYLASVSCIVRNGCFAAGFAATDSNEGLTLQTLVEQMLLPTSANQSLQMVGSDGGVFSLGNAHYLGSMGGSHLNAPIVGMASTPDDAGYWLVAADGGIFSFGDAMFYGSTGSIVLNEPIVGMASTPDGAGYWMVARDGGVFAFGDATFYGSMGASHLNAPIVGMAATPDGHGYWLVASDGGIFSFGDADFHGSMGGTPLDAPIVGMASTPDGGGYWMVASDGGIFSLGDADYYGSVPGQGIHAQVPVGAMLSTPDGRGYWLVGQDGAVYAYGDAEFLGSLVGMGLSGAVVGVAA